MYPEVSGMTNESTQQVVNTKIQELLNQDIIRFKEEVSQTEERNSTLPLPTQVEGFINELYITYKITQANNAIVSAMFPVMNFQAGADHPNNYNQVFNYDVMKNKQIVLSDLFQKDSNYLEVLSKMSREQLSTRFSDNPYASDFINEGTKPTEANFSLFTIGENELMLIFNPYQVAPYYAGTQIVKIPYSQLQPILNPSYSK
jgi:hypothetical protein